jgi:hypothetical protein
VALRIFPAVVGQPVFVALRHEYECAGDVDVSNIDVPVLTRGEWPNETFTFPRFLATWTVQRFTESPIWLRVSWGDPASSRGSVGQNHN